jgi:hypothetical protein
MKNVFEKSYFYERASITVLIRATNPAGYRFGEWGQVESIVWDRRLCYKVIFIDKVIDIWPIYDKSDPYEFKIIE